MKQVAQNYRSGELSVVEVPPPRCQPGGVLVRSLYSLISTGTEMMKVREAKLSLAGKARARPDQVSKVLDNVIQQGAVATYKKVMSRLDSYTPLGYSVSGVVAEVGQGAEEFRVGQIVACAGNEHALHSEINWVPTNLCVPVPPGVPAKLAAFATVGAIALHGVRRCEAQLGETACVVGLGLVGQLAVQLLVASGVRVVGVDPVSERCGLAEKAGALACAPATDDGLSRLERRLAEMSAGFGVDHLLLVAGGDTDDPVRTAVRLARDRARVVDIGKTRLDLPWKACYEKELEFRFSRSYGPGRYDDRYELGGVDYPVGYVRWTERRNLSCFLDLIAGGALDVESLVSGVFPLERAVEVYEQLASGALEGIGVLFEYPSEDEQKGRAIRVAPERSAARGRAGPAGAKHDGRVRIGFIGAGNYASSNLLPHLAADERVELRHVVTNRSLPALSAQRSFGFTNLTTDIDAVLGDDHVDVIFIVTRHHSHSELTCRALEAGKAVFVEKPLALSGDELQRVLDVITRTGNDRLMVGFNRRFAPLLVEMRAKFGDATAGSVARYSVNAGVLASDSWYGDAALEGTRFVGEGGHFIDTVSWWLGALPTSVYVIAASDHRDIQVGLTFDNGSIATISYLTNGHWRYPKEVFEASSAGRTARLDNFRKAQVWAGRHPRRKWALGGMDKGQRHLLGRFVEAVRDGEQMPIALESLVATSRATLAVPLSLASGQPEVL
jgi:predicted dehydrogenase/threonine dehydrogenase-like Zn-dependent dehydrogenase